MPLETLDLDPLHLTYPAEQLRLSVVSRAGFNFPSDVALHPLDWSKFLVSGNVWVGSPRVCRIDIRLSLNGTSLDSENRARILEPLGSRICDAKLWSQLSLSPSLEILPPDHLNAHQADISILLSQCPSTTTPTTYPRGWILDNVDVRAPPSVPRVQFQKLQVHLDFHSFKKNCPHAPRRMKRCWEESEIMLLDGPPSMDTSRLKVFKESADELANISPTLMAECFEQPEISPSEHGTISFGLASCSQLLQATELVMPSLPIRESLNKATNMNDKRLLYKDVKDKLQEWVDAHSTCPYPSNEEKLRLIKETGLQKRQLNQCLYSARCPLDDSAKDKYNEDEMLFKDMKLLSQSSNQPMTFRDDDVSVTNADRAIMPFSQWKLCAQDNTLSFTDDEAPSVASQPSTQTSISSNHPYMAQKAVLATPVRDNSSTILPLLGSSVLISSALNILIGGSACKRSLQSIIHENAFPKMPLTNLTPAIFCPGFKQLMAHNSRFLPTISNTISSSWVRNCQGPGLRAKLLELSNLASRESGFAHSIPSEGTEPTERLSTVVQRKVWNMMQLKLSDTSMIGKLQWLSADPGKDPVMDEDLLGSCHIDGQLRMDNGVSDNLDQLFIEEYIEDEELLLFDPTSDDEGLLSYFDEMEKAEVEMHTDEMLLGIKEYEDDDSDLVLLLDRDNEETMLL